MIDNDKLSLRSRASQLKTQRNAHAAINKIIFTVAAGTFVLSISFIGYLKNEIAWPWMLIAAWIFLAICLLVNMYAHWLTYDFAKRSIEHIDFSRSNNYIPTWNKLIAEDEYLMKKWPKKAAIIFIIVLILLILGVTCLIFFAGKNLLIQNDFHHIIINSCEKDTHIIEV